jgi:hypothetical protein
LAYNTDESVEGGLATYIKKYAERKKRQYSQQDNLDTAILALELMDNKIGVAMPPDSSGKPNALHFGIWNQLVRRDAAVLTVEPFIHFNEPNPDDAKDREHSSKLEGFVNTAIKKSKVLPSMTEMLRRDLVGKGRAWRFTSQVPQVWATEEIEALVEKAEEEKDTDKKLALLSDIEEKQRDNWPIRIRYVNPVGTYTDFGGTRWLPEVVECRKMQCDSIKDAYDIDCGCEESRGKDHEVYVYANWKCCATVIDTKDAELAHYWEHHLNKNPYSLAETNITDSDRGYRWMPQLFHAKGLIEELDKLISDRSTNSHNTALGHVMQIHDREEYPEDMIKKGRPEVVDMKPGGTTAWWGIKQVIQAPQPELTEQHTEHFKFVYEAVMRHADYPIERGETKSGDTGVSLTTSYQISQRRFSPSLDAIVAEAEDQAITVTRVPAALNSEYPGSVDKLTIFDQYKGHGALSVTPKDFLGQQMAIQAIVEPAIPVDRNRQLANARSLQEIQMSRQTVYEEAGIEDPETEIRNANRQAMLDAAIQQVGIPTAIQLSTFRFKQPTPEAQQAISTLMPDATPQLQDILTGAGVGTSSQSQSLANTGRATVPQDQSGREANLGG